MLLESSALSNPAVITADICIVGAGAAGLTVARELAGQQMRVCLLEAGGLKSDHGAQALLRAESIGRPQFPLDLIRISGFGGTTSIWAGACRPLDPIDFSVRDWVPFSGWPITRDDLEPFYARAQRVCQLGPYTYSLGDWEEAGEYRLPLQADRVDTHVFQLSNTRFGKAYRQTILNARNILTCLGMHAISIETDGQGSTATAIVASSLQGQRVRVSARAFVLAVGGIETPRLLLLSRGRTPTGLGNQHDLVGRFFMDHLYLDSGELVLAKTAHLPRLYSVHVASGSKIEGVLAIGDDAQRRRALLRCAFLFPPRWRTGTAYYSPAVTSLLHLVRVLRLGSLPYQWTGHTRSVLAGLDDVLRATRRRLVKQRHPVNAVMVRAFAEQSPNRDSRVMLSEKTDRLGRRLARVDWQVRDGDWESMREAHAVLDAEFERAWLGRLVMHAPFEDPMWSARATGGYHHMGTTRMHADPRQGVVDANCKVHGVSNLFVAGSSVFPTGGYANPTLTIVALAVRLADHIKSVYR